MNQNQNPTWDDIKEMFAEAARMSKENEKSFKETGLMFKETDLKFKETDLKFKETEKMFKETDIKFKETERKLKKESARRVKEIKESRQELKDYFKKREEEKQKWEAEREREKRESDERGKRIDARLDRLGKYLGGVSHSNGDMAEEFFYNTFRRDKTFVNQHFDEVRKNLHYKGEEDDLEMECDILLFNGKSAAMIEVKYNAKPDNVKVDNIAFRIAKFKLFFPEYANHKIYFGVAAMSFKKGFAKVLHRAGFATIRPFGKKIVIYDKEVKEF